jgi:hypothetical protein
MYELKRRRSPLDGVWTVPMGADPTPSPVLSEVSTTTPPETVSGPLGAFVSVFARFEPDA